MIFDRTQADVDSAIEIRRRLQNRESISESEINVLEKGTLTINTLNRIEKKQMELKILINGLGYWNTPIISKSWESTMIFGEDDFHRIIDNTEILKNAFLKYSTTPPTPSAYYHYKNINEIEKILHDLDLMESQIQELYVECGDIEAVTIYERFYRQNARISRDSD